MMANSPFMLEFERDVPWVLWEKQSLVSDLLEKQTDSLFGFGPLHPSEQSEQSAVQPTLSIERPQYMAIMNRMHQAAGRAGTFSNWNAVQT